MVSRACSHPSMAAYRLTLVALGAVALFESASAFAPPALSLRGSQGTAAFSRSATAGRRLHPGGLCLRAMSSGTEDKKKTEVSFTAAGDSGAGFSAVKLTDRNPGDWTKEEKEIQGDIEQGKGTLNEAKALSDQEAQELQARLNKEIDAAMAESQAKILEAYDEKTQGILEDMKTQRDIIREETEKLQALSDEIEGGKFWKGKAKKKGSLTLTIATVLAYTFAFASLNEVYKAVTDEATFIGILKGITDAFLAVVSTYIANKGPQKMIDEENAAREAEEEAAKKAPKKTGDV